MRWLHPMRTSRYVFSEAFNPGMRGVAILADAVARDRAPLPQDHPMIARERAQIDQATQALETARKARDRAYEQAFDLLYGAAGTGRPGKS